MSPNMSIGESWLPPLGENGLSEAILKGLSEDDWRTELGVTAPEDALAPPPPPTNFSKSFKVDPVPLATAVGSELAAKLFV